MNEVWKQVENYSNYEISNLGNIKGKKGLLKPSIKNGYYFVGLSKNNQRKDFYIHRLVAEHFIPNPENKNYIDHINTDRTDNRVENLRWVTRSENMNNPITIEKCRKRELGKIGKQHNKSKPIIQFTKQGEFIREWDCAMDVQRELGLNSGKINACCRGEQSTSGGFRWLYKSEEETLVSIQPEPKL